ncbi:MAG: hypothetical protein WCO60_10865 [Verrucomicrobiota bacterium]
MSSKSSPANQPPKSIRTIRPLTEADTKGAPFVSLVDTAKFTGLGEAILRKGCKITKFGNAHFVRVAEVNKLILGDEAEA